MSWPLSHEFNEAIQSPKATMSDPDLRAAEVVVGATGLPLPRSGNFADVYQFRAPDGREWAVKCFTRPVAGLAERYAKLSAALAAAELPFAVGFTFLPEGIRVGGAWRPVLKMDWVEGLLLNQLVRDNTASQKVLGALGQMWSRLSKRLREAGFAHADVQHGNVLLVPGARAGAYGLKLIDYDGMWVKALANNPSGEVGHPSFQHPDRARTRAYSPDLDRFPHLVVATALRGLGALGPALWDRYDNGDNMLFGEADFRAPAESPLMRELWHAGDAGLRALVGRLAVACGKPIPQTPWLDLIAPEGDPVPLTEAEHRAALEALGLPVPVPVPVPALPPEPVAPAPARAGVPPPAAVSDVELVEVEPAPAPRAAAAFEALDADDERPARPARERKKKHTSETKQKSSRGPLYAGAGLAAVLAVVTAVLLLKAGKPPEVAEEPKEPPVAGPTEPAPKKKVEPKDPPKVEPKEPPQVEPKDPPKVEPKEPERPARVAAREGWSFDLPADFPVPRVYVTADSKIAIVVSDRGAVILLDATTGKVVPSPFTKIDWPVRVRPVRDALALVSVKGKGAGVVDVRTGEMTPIGNLLRLNDMYKNELPTVNVSSDLRYVTVGYTRPEKPASYFLEVVGGRGIRAVDWQQGNTHFTSDSKRVLIADRTGRCQWFKLPGGEPDGEWVLEPARDDPTVSGLRVGSADGSVFVYDGPLAGRAGTHHVIDGRTGRVLHSLLGCATQFHSITADGTLGVFPKRNNAGRLSSAPVIDLVTGTEVGELPAPVAGASIIPTILPNGRGAVALTGEPLKVVRYDFESGAVAVDPKQPIPPTTVPPIWTKPTDQTVPVSSLAFNEASGAIHVLASGPGATYALANGAPKEGFEMLTSSNPFLIPLTEKTFQRAPRNPLTVDVVNASTGKLLDKRSVPTLPGQKANSDEDRALLSSNERYVAHFRSSRVPSDRKLPVHVYDAGKPVLEETWIGGTVRFAPDNKRVMLADTSGHVRWFRLPAGTPDGEWKLERAVKSPLLPVIAPDGTTVCYYSASLTWVLLDGETGKKIASFEESAPVPAPVYSGNSKRLAAVHARLSAVQVFSTTDGKPVASLPKQTPRALALSNSGQLLAVADSARSEVALFELPRAPADLGKQPDPKPVNDGSPPLTGTPVVLVSKWKAELGALKPDRVALVPAANLLALGASEGGFATVDLTKGEVRNTGFITLRAVPLADLVALDRGQLASLAPKATEFRLWDAKAGAPRVATARFPDLPAGAGEVRAAISPDGKWVAAGRWGAPDAPLRIADAQTPIKPLVSTTWTDGTVHFTADGTRALVAENGKCRWFQLPSGKDGGEVRVLTEARVAALSADGKRVVLARVETGIPDGRFHVWDGDTGKSVRVVPSAYSARYPVALSPDGKRFAAVRTTGPDAPALELIDIDAGTRLAVAALEAKDVSALELAPDGKSLYVVSQKAGTVWAFAMPAAPKS